LFYFIKLAYYNNEGDSVARKRYRASAVVVADNKLLTVLLEDPKSKLTRYFIPGGKIEESESPEDAARREILEETGIEASIISDSKLVATYPFVWNGELFECTTTFFAATCRCSFIPTCIEDTEYNLGAQWIPLTQLDEKMGFDQNILGPIKSLIAKYFQ